MNFLNFKLIFSRFYGRNIVLPDLMSDQLPSHDSLPQSLTEFNPSQDNLDNQDEEENLQDSLSKSGFKRRAIIHQSSDALSDIEKNGATWLPDTSEPLTFKESTQSEFMVSNSPEKGSFSGMGFQPAEYSSLQTLKCIINEAKQAERYMFSGKSVLCSIMRHFRGGTSL